MLGKILGAFIYGMGFCVTYFCAFILFGSKVQVPWTF